MKYLASLFVVLALCYLGGASAAGQAGRRSTETPKAVYTVPLPDNSGQDVKIKQDAQDQSLYYCVDSKQTAAAADEEIYSPKDLTTKAQILSKPQPKYTMEARRNGTSGRATLRILLSSTARITTVKVIRELPDGLTESAVKAACGIRFKPATKDDRPVAQYLTVEYGFMTNLPYGPRSTRPPFSRP